MTDPVYGNASDFETYWVARGQQAAIVAFDDTDVNAALLVASEYLDAAFRTQYMGLKVGGRDQVREWPRIGVQDNYGYSVPSTDIPREVLAATYQAAFRQLQTPGVFFKDYSPSKYRSVSVSGAVSVTYAIGDAYDFQTQMPALAAMLAPILTGAGTGSFSAASGFVARV